MEIRYKKRRLRIMLRGSKYRPDETDVELMLSTNGHHWSVHDMTYKELERLQQKITNYLKRRKQ